MQGRCESLLETAEFGGLRTCEQTSAEVVELRNQVARILTAERCCVNFVRQQGGYSEVGAASEAEFVRCPGALE